MVETTETERNLLYNKIHKTLPLHLLHFHKLPSTNKWCEENLTTLVSDYGLNSLFGVRVSVNHQTSGIGQDLSFWEVSNKERASREWIFTKESLAVSFVFTCPEDCLQNISMLSLVVGVATCKTLSSFGISAQIKWPNDIFVCNRKVAGILCRSKKLQITAENKMLAIIIGIGINVKTSPLIKNEYLASPDTNTSISLVESLTTSTTEDAKTSFSVQLYENMVAKITASNVLEELTITLYDYYYKWKTHGVQYILHDINNLLYCRGKQVRITYFDTNSQRSAKEIIGSIDKIDNSTGALIVIDKESMAPVSLLNGSVVSLQPLH
jgi:biotin-[acetyl-CoA-carboxylase] ligase BirA-like protein